MRGSDDRSGSLFSYVDLEKRIRPDHPLRTIRRVVDDALASLDRTFADLYAAFGRPSIPPERLLRATAWCTDGLAGAEELSGVGERLLSCPWMPIVPFKLNQERRHHIPRQKRKVTNSPAYDASLGQRGSLTVWFTDAAIDAWAAEPRTTRGGQPWYSALAILTALTLRAVFRLAFRQTEGLIGSIIGLLGLMLRVPDHTTLSRRAATLEVPRPQRPSTEAGREAAPLHLLVDSTGLRQCGPGEWLVEKHGSCKRRS